MHQIGFIGAGQMAQALGKGISNSHPTAQFVISDPSTVASDGFVLTMGDQGNVAVVSDNQGVVDEAEIIFLAVKPQYLNEAVEDLNFDNSKLIVSIVAGYSIRELQHITQSERIIRVMPNTPCLIGKGASGIAGSDGTTQADLDLVKSLLETSGIVVDVPEQLIDSVTGVSGSGPAYVFTFIEAMIDGGVLVGLHREQARKLAIQTVIGSAQMMLESGKHPGVLRDQVTSPGGTTIAALRALEESGLRDSVMSAVETATERARELGGH